MFLISFLAVVLVIGLYLIFSGGIIYFIDTVSMLTLVLIVVPVLIQTGLLKDFNNSFRLTFGKKSKASFKEIKRAIEALKLVRTTSFYTAIFVFCVSVILIITQITSPDTLGPNLAVAVLILVYGALLNLIFFPMEKQLEVRLIEFDGEELLENMETQKQMEIQKQMEAQKQMKVQKQMEIQKQVGAQKQMEVQKQLEVGEILELGEKQLEEDKVEQ